MAQVLTMERDFWADLTVKGPRISIDKREYGGSSVILWCDCCVLWIVWLVRLHLKQDSAMILPIFFCELVTKIP